jgi:hypothetical protein
MFVCIKYSYTSGIPVTRKVSIKDDMITYKGFWKSDCIESKKIRGIAYGPRTSTFSMVKECIPWLIASVITADRTYDLEFTSLHEVKKFILTMHDVNTKYDHNMVIPQLEHIDMDNLWMQHNAPTRALKMFQNPKWNTWLNNRNRKYKIVNSKHIQHYHNETDSCDSCSVCFEPYNDNNFVCQLACGHTFHIECISQWFQRSFTCPLCRMSIS